MLPLSCDGAGHSFQTFDPPSLFNALRAFLQYKTWRVQMIEIEAAHNSAFFTSIDCVQAIFKGLITTTMHGRMRSSVENTKTTLERMNLEWAQIMSSAAMIGSLENAQDVFTFGQISSTAPHGSRENL